MEKYIALFLLPSSLGLVEYRKYPVEKEKTVAVSLEAAVE